MVELPPTISTVGDSSTQTGPHFARPNPVGTVVPDNLKAAVIRAAFGVDEAASLNRSYRELARHYQMKIDPAPICAPKEKGKVELGGASTSSETFAGRDQNGADDTKRELARWVDAGARVPG